MLKKYFYVLAALLLVLSSSVVFAGGNAVGRGLTDQAEILGDPTGTATSTWNFDYPNQVQRFRFSCTASTYVRVGIRDYGIAGDIWNATFRIYDATPVTSTLIGTGSTTSYKYGHLWGVYTYAMNPLQGYIEIRYHQGVNVFPAAATLEVYCPGVVTLTNLGLSSY